VIGRASTAALLVLAPAPALASAEDVVGYGTRSPAMAGVGAASATQYDAVYLNPAGLVDAEPRAMTYGFSATHFDVSGPERLDGAGRPVGRDPRIEPARGGIIGVTLRIPFAASWKDRVTLGMGFYVPTNVVVRGDILLPEEPQMLLLGSRMQTVAIQIALGVRLTDRLSLGAGFRALAELIGSIRVSTDATGRIGSRSDSELVATYAPTFGARYRLDGRTTLGLAFRGALEGNFDYDIYTEGLPLPLPVMNVEGIAQYDPMTVVLEGARRFGPLLVEGGLGWKRWSAYPGPTVATTVAASAPPRARSSDVLVPRVAAEWEIRSPGASLLPRVGVAYEDSPLGPGRAVARWYDNDRLVLGTGLGLSIHRSDLPPIRLDVHEQVQWLVPRDHADGQSTSGLLWSTGVTAAVTF
jgi:long-chain fatty acid transport protein